MVLMRLIVNRVCYWLDLEHDPFLKGIYRRLADGLQVWYWEIVEEQDAKRNKSTER